MKNRANKVGEEGKDVPGRGNKTSVNIEGFCRMAELSIAGASTVRGKGICWKV